VSHKKEKASGFPLREVPGISTLKKGREILLKSRVFRGKKKFDLDSRGGKTFISEEGTVSRERARSRIGRRVCWGWENRQEPSG